VLDLCQETLVLGRRKVKRFPEVLLVRANANYAPFRRKSFDVVMSSAMFHHLCPTQWVSMLLAMDALSRRTLVVQDLIRRRRAYLWIRLLTSFGASPVVRQDGPVSVLRGFIQEEVEDWVKRSGLTYLRWHEHFGHRFCLAGEKSSG
jgi:hypothetical protein